MSSFTHEWQKPWIKKESAVKKKTRAALIRKRLKKVYPHAKIALQYQNDIQLLVAVILSAQCTDKKVNEVTRALFAKYKTAKDFASADTKTLESEIRQTGFYHAKARSIKEACGMIVKQFDGKIPQTMEEITKLRGVARKTANVVLGNAFGVVEGIAVDTHVRRLAQRLGFTKHENPDKIERELIVLVPKKDWFRLTYLLIDHGRAICNAQRPKCQECVLKDFCPSSRV